MIEILKEDLRKFMNFIGAMSIGAIFLKHEIVFSRMHIFIFFLFIMGIYFMIYKSIQSGFENSIIEILFLSLIYAIPMDTRLKALLFGAFVFISIRSIFNTVRDTKKGKELLIAILYISIMGVVAVLFFLYPNSIKELRSIEDTNDLMWILIGMISLIGNI